MGYNTPIRQSRICTDYGRLHGGLWQYFAIINTIAIIGTMAVIALSATTLYCHLVELRTTAVIALAAMSTLTVIICSVTIAYIRARWIVTGVGVGLISLAVLIGVCWYDPGLVDSALSSVLSAIPS